MKILFSLMLLSIALHAFAEETIKPVAPVESAPGARDEAGEERRSNYMMNARYRGGPFLVYDCEGQYYACVDQDGTDSCAEKRTKSMEKKESKYPCAPLKKFPNKEACLQKNYDVMESMALKRFCFPK